MSWINSQASRAKLIGDLKSGLQAAIQPNMSLPGVVGIIVFLGADKAQMVNDSARSLLPGLPAGPALTALATGLIIFASLSVVTFLRIKFLNAIDPAASYLLATVVSITLAITLIEVTLGPNFAIATSNWVRLFVTTFLLSILVGNYRKWVAAELFKSLGLVENLEQQRKLLIDADEKARREIADLLHDSVQSKLVVVATKLNQISKRAPAAVADDLQPLLIDIETLRSLDVRNASRALSPDLAVLGLKNCLEDLGNVYADTMAVTFQFDGLSDGAESELGLAIYRICEQGLLNALAHGNANNCAVKLWSSQGLLNLEIVNDGLPIPNQTQSAKGSAIIAAWVASFGGSWSLTNLDDGHVSLIARLSLVNKPLSLTPTS